MKRTILVVALSISAPAAAQQARVYTNADLVRAVRSRAPAPSPPRNSVASKSGSSSFSLALPDGPRVVGVWSSPTAGPFGEFPHYRSRWLDGGLPLYGYSWGVAPYRVYGSSGRGYGSTRSSSMSSHRGTVA